MTPYIFQMSFDPFHYGIFVAAQECVERYLLLLSVEGSD